VKKRLSLGKKKQIILAAMWTFVILAILAALIRHPVFLLLTIAAGAVFIVLICVWWRCPACGGSLGRVMEQGDFCTKCGAEIDWDKE